MKYHHLTQLNVTDPLPMALGPAVRPEAPAPAPCPVAAFERGDRGSATIDAKGLPSVAEPADPMAEFTQGILRRMAGALGVDPDLLAEAEVCRKHHYTPDL